MCGFYYPFDLAVDFPRPFHEHFIPSLATFWTISIHEILSFFEKSPKSSKIDHFTSSHVTEAPINLYRPGLVIRLYNTSSGAYQCIGTVFKSKEPSVFEISVPPKSGSNLDLGFLL